jgi:transcriptional regulator with XRE-family HTH domain
MVRPRKRGGPPRLATNALGRWIDRKDITRNEVAERLGISRRYLDRLCSDTRRPNLELAVAIEDLTRGKVKVRSWLKTPRHSGD